MTASRRLVQLTPTREDLLDAGALGLLGMIAIVEFRSTFSGWQFLLVAVLGLVLGIVIAHLANVLAQPVIVLAAMGLAAFFLLGGAVALRNDHSASALPTGSTLRRLAEESVHGWKDLVTTLPRVNGSGALLVLPYLLALFCGLGGFALARRTKASFAPVLVPFAVFAAVILLGSARPGGTVVLAVLFALVAVIWGTVRSRRLRPIAQSGASAAARVATAAGLLAVAGLGAYVGGAHVPGAGSHDRLVLRSYVKPPINISDYPSPLASYRLYAGHQKSGNQVVSLADKTLFTVHGNLPAGTPLRFAILDSYNGIVWAASDGSAAAQGTRPDSFLRVGTQVDNPVPGPAYTMTVDVDSYDDYWMPLAGAVQKIAFTDTSAASQSTDFRYNLATNTGLVPGKLAQGSSYRLTVAAVRPANLTSRDALAGDGSSQYGAFLKTSVTALGGSKGTTTEQVLAMAQNLKATGRYTHGDPGTVFAYYLPGHSVGRLTDFVKGVIPGVLYVGDDEQYAAAYALMIEQLGVPARVVMGVSSLPASGVVKGSDVDAWVEVQLTDGSWREIPTDQFLDKNNPPDQKQLQQQQKQEAGSVVPPPAQGRPRTTLDESAQSVGDSTSKKRKAGTEKSSFHLPGWLVSLVSYVAPPLGFLMIVAGAIVGAKTLRRHRRRTRGAPETRLARGWREVIDHARDLGHPVMARSTRREQAQALAELEVLDLARLADSHVFGQADVTDADAQHFWSQVGHARKRMSSGHGRRRRLRAALSLGSYLPQPMRGQS